MLKEKRGKRRIMFIVELVIILALLPGCFRKEELLDAFSGEDILELTAQVESNQVYCGDKLTLNPGVYQIRVRTNLAEGQSMYVQMEYDQAYFKALRNNGMSIGYANDYADFEVYVLDKVPAAYVQCSFHGTDAGALARLELWKTNLGRRMLFLIVVVFFGALDFLVEFRRRILEGKVTREQQVVFWTLAGGVLVAYFPYLTDYFSIGADSIYHWGRIAYLADALKLGAPIPVRVEGTWLCGHGYATSLFYGDFFLYIPAFLRLLGFSIMSSYKIFVFLVLAATAAIAYHSFHKCVKDEYAALFGSMVYLLAPYHLLNIYNRGAVGEYLAMTFLPLVCCGMYLLYTGDVASREYGQYKWYVILGMSAVLQSHLISTEMTAVIMLAFCVIYWKKTFRRQTFCQLVEATGIVLAVNAWFWLPMLYMLKIDAYHLRELISEKGQQRGVLFAGLFQLLPNKGSGQTGMWQCEPAQIGAGAVMMFLLYILWISRRKQGREGDGTCLFALAGAILVLMSTKYLPWDAIAEIPIIGSIVGSLQFPTRWLTPAIVFVSMFTAFFFRQAMKEGGTLFKASMGIAAAIVIFSAVYHVNDIANVFGPIWLYNEENMGTSGVVNGEYLLEGTTDLDFYYHKPVAEEGLAWSDYEKSGTHVVIALENVSDGVRHIDIPLIGYKGYGVRAPETEEGVPRISAERGAHSDLRLDVPAGYRGTIEISYQGFALFRAAEAVSLAAVLAILVFCIMKHRLPRWNGDDPLNRVAGRKGWKEH